MVQNLGESDDNEDDYSVQEADVEENMEAKLEQVQSINNDEDDIKMDVAIVQCTFFCGECCSE